MTTEEKAKAYDEALKIATDAHKDTDKHLKATLERIFPELRESEKPLTPFQQCLNSILLKVYYASVPGKVDKFILDIIKNRTDELVELAKRHEYTDCQLRESDDERIRQKLVWLLQQDICPFPEEEVAQMVAYLEKQKNKKYEMIQWTGDNLNEVIKFTGKSPMFEKWFKSWEEYEEYVHSHGNIFKLFNDDGSHYEAPVSAWIVKTPDGNKIFSEVIKLFT